MIASLIFLSVSPQGRATATDPYLTPSDPVSSLVGNAPAGLSLEFCEKNNPDFYANGNQCCFDRAVGYVGNTPPKKKGFKSWLRRVLGFCPTNRRHHSFKNEVTEPQRALIEQLETTDHPMAVLNAAGQSDPSIAACTASSGFLKSGVPIVESKNPLVQDAFPFHLRNPERFGNFGTLPLVKTLYALAAAVGKEFSISEGFKGRALKIGDLSAPSGGCMASHGGSGKRAHASHTNGLDVDLGFFNPSLTYQDEERFTELFYVASNWWLLKKLVSPEFQKVACIREIYTGKRPLALIERYASGFSEYPVIRKLLSFKKGHHHHFHIRVGRRPGLPGCPGEPKEFEGDDEPEENEDAVLTASVGEGLYGASSAVDSNENEESPIADEGSAEVLANPKDLESTPPILQPESAHKREPAITQALTPKRRAHRKNRRRKK